MTEIKIYRPYTIQVLERTLLPPAPGSAEPRHSYSVLFTVRADVKTAGGQSEFAKVDINGKTVTHVFGIRFTTIPFDVRNRLRDARGNLYQILKVENVDQADREIKIYAANQGAETVEAAR